MNMYLNFLKQFTIGNNVIGALHLLSWLPGHCYKYFTALPLLYIQLQVL